MTDTKKIKVYAAIIPTLIITVVTIMIELRGERCFGLVDAFVTIFLLGLLGLTLLFTLIIQIIKIVKGHLIRHRIGTIVFCLILTTLSVAATTAPNDYFQSPAILTAELTKTLDIGRLTLRKDNTYSALYGHIDWSCIKKGDYKILGDTIFLENKIVEQSDSIFSSKYLIKDGTYLLPLVRLDYLTNKDYWMEIKK